jgi:hypothetical protein
MNILILLQLFISYYFFLFLLHKKMKKTNIPTVTNNHILHQGKHMNKTHVSKFFSNICFD